MQHFTFYDGSKPIEIQCDFDLLHITKICFSYGTVFLLDIKHDLQIGTINDAHQLVNLELLRSSILDVVCSKYQIYIVQIDGCVYQASLTNINCGEFQWHEIIVPNPKTCPHGIRSSIEKIPIARINCNEDGLLFTSQKQDLYAMGNFGDVVQSEIPIPVECFTGFKILQITTGDNFVVVLTHRKKYANFLAIDDKSEESNDSAVFLNSECPKCASNSFQMKNSEQSISDTSLASSSSQSDIFECGSISTDTVHKELALNYLLDTLSIKSNEVDQSKGLNGNCSDMLNNGIRSISRQISASSSQTDLAGGHGHSEIDSKSLISFRIDHSEAGMDASFCDDLSTTDLASCAVDNGRSEAAAMINVEKVYSSGANILGTCVWCFGSVNKGLLGTGDHIKRTRISPVLGLTGQGVVKISSGQEHSLALTLDGRLYLWGNNSKQQISAALEVEDISSPRRFQSTQNVLDATCGNYSTYVLTNDLKIKEMKKDSIIDESKTKTFDIVMENQKLSDSTIRKCSLILASGEFYLQNHIKPPGKAWKYLTVEQKCLQETLYSYYTIIKQFLKKIYLIGKPKSQIFDQLCQQYQNVLNLMAVSVETMLDYVRGTGNYLDILFIMWPAEFIAALRLYIKAVSNVISVQGIDIIKSMLPKSKDLQQILMRPLSLISNHIEFIDYLLIDCSMNKSFLEGVKNEWERFLLEKDSTIAGAQITQNFWDISGKNLISKLQTAERRLLLDSKETIIKLHPSGRFSSHWFLLFNDAFCHCSGSTVSVYALKVVWVNSIVDNETRKNAFKLITPEEIFILVAQNHEIKMKWIETIEKNIKQCLDKPLFAKIPQSRNASYTFSEKHHKYPGAKYFGRWYIGQMHGIGHLELADGRVFNGQMGNGEMSGFGRMYIPGSGIYEGDFVRGKYHGYGILEIKNKGTYEGHFKDGMSHGHGILRSNSFTYIGEFKYDMMYGYGVLDNEQNGEKYLGMFVDNRKSGCGSLIAMDGKYFEGQFAADTLCGDGLAILTNGSYYEGELTFSGPNGKGTLFLPALEVKSEAVELDCRNIEMTGNVMTGNMSGIWEDVKIYGSIAMNQSFPKFPATIGMLTINQNQKWQSLFQDWETDVFGSHTINDCKDIWNRVPIFITNSKRKDILKSDGFCDKNRELAATAAAVAVKQNGEDQQASKSYYGTNIECQSNGSIASKINAFPGSLNSQINKLIHEANKLDDANSNTNDFMYDNLKNGANLFEIFKAKNDISIEKILNTSNSYDYDDSSNNQHPQRRKSILDNLDFIPDFGVTKLDKQDLVLVKDYLAKAFRDNNHPFGVLNNRISYCFYASYGCWKVKPTSILSDQAMKEWDSISKRIYGIVRKMFPALPEDSDLCDGDMVSHQSLMYPILLSEGVYSTLFVLYASKCSQNDELYRQRVLICDKKSDEELAMFLKMSSHLLPLIKSKQFEEIITCFKQVKEKYCPREMLSQIEMTFKSLNEAKNEILGKFNVLNADNIMPLTIFLILRAGIPHLGAEILLLEDLMGVDFESIMQGFAGYCFATIKATYQHILSDKFFQE